MKSILEFQIVIIFKQAKESSLVDHFAMNSKVLAICIATMLGKQICLAATESVELSLLVALDRTGGNRSEMETALRKVKGKDTDYFVTFAPQCDLVRLTEQHIIENLTYARKVHEALPYLGEKLDNKLWREWVLPYRVLNEDLDLWRKDFYERMQPVVQGTSTTKAAVDAIHTWLMEPNETGVARVGLCDAENRPKTPSQVLKFGGGTCGELSMLFVALLRSVGIPARHCMMSWKYNLNDRHFYCEYWDAQLHCWIPLDSSDNQPITGTRTPQEKTKSGNWNSLVLYAHPGFTCLRDVYDTDCFDGCLNVSENVCATYSCTLGTKEGLAGRSTAYVWNLQNWRAIAGAPPDGGGSSAAIVLADTRRVERPVLFTLIKGNQLWWGLRRPSRASDAIPLERAEAGRCLQWNDYEYP